MKAAYQTIYQVVRNDNSDNTSDPYNVHHEQYPIAHFTVHEEAEKMIKDLIIKEAASAKESAENHKEDDQAEFWKEEIARIEANKVTIGTHFRYSEEMPIYEVVKIRVFHSYKLGQNYHLLS